MGPVCRVCGVVLNKDNWYPSFQKKNSRVCKKCERERLCLWRKANPDKVKAEHTRYNRKRGQRPMNENKECSTFLGVHIAERVLGHVFKDVEVMPYGNHGYDFICNHGKIIDVKSACKCKNISWAFHIGRNMIPDYFLCLAFDNREDLNPLHVWLLTGSKFNHLVSTTIRPSTIHKWDEYKLDIAKIATCCEAMR